MVQHCRETKTKRRVLICAALVLCGLFIWTELLPSGQLLGHRLRFKPELIAGKDRISQRIALLLRAGLVKMSPHFAPASELASDSKCAQKFFGGSTCAAPDAKLLAQDMPPSTALLPAAEAVPAGITAVSLVCPSRDLFHSRTGILRHPEWRGRESERVAWMSARVGNQLLIESPIGLRLHGGHSRFFPQKSLTMVFREEISGYAASPAGLFFGPDTPAAQHIILMNAGEMGRFNAALATEIAELLGCKVSRHSPALLYVNGTRVAAPYFLYQQQSPELVAARYGMKEVDWMPLKSATAVKSRPFINARRWIKLAPAPMSMAEAAQKFELADITAWALAIGFTSTWDNNQGAYFRDNADPSSKWQSLVWDMDASFNDDPVRGKPGHYAHQQPFDLLEGYRAELFRRLFNESAEYRAHFLQTAEQALSTVARKEVLLSLADRYIQLATTQTGPDSHTVKVLRDTRHFLEQRTEFYLSYIRAKAKQAE
jgi:hypothetical protein